jgi:hypothetical protein
MIFKRGFALVLWKKRNQAWGCSNFVKKTFRDDGLCQ